MIGEIEMKKTMRRYWILGSFYLILALVLSVVTPQIAAAQEPPDRPDIPQPPRSQSSNRGSYAGDTGRIVLSTRPDAWAVVQWQDGMGWWHDVDGWRGSTGGGVIAWTVEEKDFGSGPFRWVVYHPQTGEVFGASYPFYLPEAGEIVSLEIQNGWRPASAPRRYPPYRHPWRPCTQ